MSLIGLIIFVAVVGFLLWLFNAKVPMESTLKAVLNFIVILIVVLIVVSFFFGADLGHIGHGHFVFWR